MYFYVHFENLLVVKTRLTLTVNIIVYLFGLWLNIPVNSIGHVESVSYPKHFFSPGQAYFDLAHVFD